MKEIIKQDIENVEDIKTLFKKNNNNIKFIIVGIISLILVIIAFIFVIAQNTSKVSKSDLKIDENTLIMLQKDEKYGFIDTKGKLVIDFKYDKADKFIGNYTKVKEGDSYKIIDDKGKIKFESKNSSDFEYIDDYNIWIIKNELYNSSLKRISPKNTIVKYIDDGYLRWNNEKENKAGIMSVNGKILYSYKLGKNEKSFSFNEIGIQNINDNTYKYCVVSIDGAKYGIVNCNSGKVVLDYVEDNVSKKSSSCFEIKNVKNYSFKKRIIIVNDKVVYESEDKGEIIYNYDYYFNIYSSKKRSNYYISKIDGKQYNAEPMEKEDLDKRSELEKLLNIEKTKCDNRYGLKKNGKTTIKCEYNDLIYFDEDVMKYLDYNKKNYVIGFKDNTYYLLNYKNGKVINKFETEHIGILDKSLFISYIVDDKKYVYSLIKNKSVEYDKDTTIALYSNYYTVKNDDKLDYYNTSLKKIYTN